MPIQRERIIVLVGGLQHLDLHLELAGQRNHGHHFGDGVDVAAFEITGGEPRLFADWRRVAGTGAKQAVGAAHQIGLFRVDQLDAADSVDGVLRAGFRHHGNGAVLADADLDVRRHRDGAAIALHGNTGAGLDDAIDGYFQAAVARVGLAAIRHSQRDPARSLDRHVERATGVLQRTRFETGVGAGIDDEGASGQRRRRIGRTDRHRAQAMLLGAVAGRRGIGQVVRHRRLAPQRMRGAAHRGVDQSIHGVSPRLTFMRHQRRLTSVCRILSCVLMVWALA